jgi:hypothetical protein
MANPHKVWANDTQHTPPSPFATQRFMTPLAHAPSILIGREHFDQDATAQVLLYAAFTACMQFSPRFSDACIFRRFAAPADSAH